MYMKKYACKHGKECTHLETEVMDKSSLFDIKCISAKRWHYSDSGCRWSPASKHQDDQVQISTNKLLQPARQVQESMNAQPKCEAALTLQFCKHRQAQISQE